MKTIVLALDFSATTPHTLGWAKLFARQYDAELVLVHVASMPMPGPTIPAIGGAGLDMGMMMGETMPLDTEPIYADQLAELSRQLQAEGIRCRTDMRRGGVDGAILEAAQEHNADLIILGRSHAGTFFDRMLGSTAADVVANAHRPVLVIPADSSDGLAQEGVVPDVSVGSVVFSTALEFDQQEAFQQVVDLTNTFGASLRLLRVVAENQPDINDDAQILAPLQVLYGAEPLVVDRVASNTVTGGITDYLRVNAVDLLVMTTRERGFLTGLLNPSLTGKMVGRSDVPLLVYQAKGDL